MNNTRNLPAAILLVALTATCMRISAAPDVRVGMWETTIQSVIEGMPMSPPPMTHRGCITEADLVPHMESPGQECKILEHSVSGNSVTWRIQCSHEGMSTSGTGKITYAGDHYEGSVEMNVQGGPMGAMKMTQSMTGRRVGDCP